MSQRCLRLLIAGLTVLALQACAIHRIDETAGTKKAGAPYCVQETGSHIEREPGECGPGNGRTYSHEDLERSGQPTTGAALKRTRP